MVGIGRLVRWARALLACSVAIALLAVPAAGRGAPPCGDHGAHERSTAPNDPPLPTVHDRDEMRIDSRAAAGMACCGAACSSYLAAAETDAVAELDPPGARQLLDWGDVTGAGLTVPPTHGPPRTKA